ncbi:limonene-1,2-epoxide hydrolase [Luteibacter sp. W1I16]|uniref:ester cyclase n=1 Tax=Luteibacter sp. W1I16 TaxID=3373922 RepID=UPI003D25B96C
MNNRSVDIVERFWRAVWVARDPAAVDRLVAEDFTITSGGIDIHGREAFKSWIAGFLASIADFHFESVETFQNATGDRVASRWKISGRNNGFMGLEPCGTPFDMTGTAIWHVREDGLLQHNWVERSALEVHRAVIASRAG